MKINPLAPQEVTVKYTVGKEPKHGDIVNAFNAEWYVQTTEHYSQLPNFIFITFKQVTRHDGFPLTY